ncbi:MAG: NADP-dependent isocitrate dehydrogenase [Verrucomicrobia bacterium]|nr:MAG: NADP-dependent isocitrate dehydrogenase [Verrucomicrobiota bacterium]
MSKTPITVAYGDGIGPEIMEATLHIIESAGAQLEIERIDIGEKMYLAGHPTGIDPSAWESLRRTKVFLKSPITTPQGGGFKSLNVTARKALGLYANVRPCVSYHPFVATKHPFMDVVIIRENEEDLYAGIEHRQSQDVISCTKLISRPGCEKIVRYAFEYALLNNRKKVTCFTKDNIMKMTDGLFHKVFDEIAMEYPGIEKEHWIVDIGAAKLADTPQVFDVMVLPNLYGDILSDIAAQIAGSVGLAGSSNIGNNAAMFEAIHGSAPRRAGQNLANPSGLFLGSILMLLHIGQAEVAERAHNAWLCTLEEGIHTYDIFDEAVSRQKVGTKEFALAVVARLGQKPQRLKPVSYKKESPALHRMVPYCRPQEKKELIGADVFIEHQGQLDDLIPLLVRCGMAKDKMMLEMVDNRGMIVWPQRQPDLFYSDSFRARYKLPDGTPGVISHNKIIELLQRITLENLEFLKVELLYNFDGQPGFTRGQGQ